MGMHLMVVAAIHLSRAGSIGAAGASPGLAANLIWPFLVKLCLSVQVNPHDWISSSRFLIFQFAQIFARNSRNDENQNNNRWDRAIRLVRERIDLARDSHMSLRHDDEESLHILSMLAL